MGYSLYSLLPRNLPTVMNGYQCIDFLSFCPQTWVDTEPRLNPGPGTDVIEMTILPEIEGKKELIWDKWKALCYVLGEKKSFGRDHGIGFRGNTRTLPDFEVRLFYKKTRKEIIHDIYKMYLTDEIKSLRETSSGETNTC